MACADRTAHNPNLPNWARICIFLATLQRDFRFKEIQTSMELYRINKSVGAHESTVRGKWKYGNIAEGSQNSKVFHKCQRMIELRASCYTVKRICLKRGMMQRQFGERKTRTQTLKQSACSNSEQNSSLRGQHVDTVPRLILHLLTSCKGEIYALKSEFPLNDI